MAKILLVEDDQNMREAVRDWLSAQRYLVETCPDGERAKGIMSHSTYDLIILDWDIPFINGLDLCRGYRADGGKTPVIMLTGKSATKEKILGLDSGADDYITKPFDMEELLAKIRAILRRDYVSESTTISFGDLVLDSVAHQITAQGNQVTLSPTEFQLLSFLIQNPTQYHTTESLVLRIWNGGSSIEAVRTYISQARKRLSVAGSKTKIESTPGVGYRLITVDADSKC